MSNPNALRSNPNTEKLWCHWSNILNSWVVCDAVDKGAVLFHRAVANS